MKKYTILLLMLFTCLGVFGKKDTEAWKQEKNLEQQFVVFKDNLNFWNGSYFMKPEQLSEFYNSLTDTISELKLQVNDEKSKVTALQAELNTENDSKIELQKQLDESIKHQDAITVFGFYIQKTVYASILYSIILGLLILTVVVFVLFKRSNTITVRTKKEFKELNEEFETHKKNALDRYTKMNMELHKTRLELNKK